MNKNELVIEKAKELFTKHGYKRVSMDEIAKEAGVTKKTVYSYFKDKDDLFVNVIRKELDEIKNNLDSYEDEGKTFLENVSYDIYFLLKEREKSILFSNIVREYQNTKKDNFLKMFDDEMINFIENKVQKGIKDGNIKECNGHLVSFIIYKVYIALMFEYEENLDAEKVTKEITHILKDGLFN